ncbi:TRAP transporter small permease (plasmid) [Haloferax prahovense]|jgi:TRAP-type C4-dicarboxylate transport system permease small subunit|uniref:TRAP transporter small permease n=1 Tax=Haloferax prahovense TaxID=381852 RepID=UPI003C75FB8E
MNPQSRYHVFAQKAKALLMRPITRKYDQRLAAWCVIAIAALISYRIFARQFNFPTLGVGEVSQILVLWVVYLILGRMEADDRHLKVEFFYNQFPGPVQRVVDVFVDLLHAATITVILYSTVDLAIKYQDTTTPISDVPVSVLFLSAAVGCVTFLLVSLSRVIKFVQSYQSHTETNAGDKQTQ